MVSTSRIQHRLVQSFHSTIASYSGNVFLDRAIHQEASVITHVTSSTNPRQRLRGNHSDKIGFRGKRQLIERDLEMLCFWQTEEKSNLRRSRKRFSDSEKADLAAESSVSTKSCNFPVMTRTGLLL
ncbi:hypothetical protein JTE90_005643 [Oedothorax gibbosus]|uniref:Uncharacterized protein n=1 Tax=Oedothorax gibbosus TaxID=931172 RepID=A0AAV6UHR9_9ARAC|nr:hypothetical protein JTE90_005643 [Oedothorax gibbosus]